MPTKPEDVSVAWGQQRSQADTALERWWHAVYQDMVPSFDGSRLYFLYDQSVEGSGSHQAITVFDPQAKRFLREIPLTINEGRVKYFYMLKHNELALFVQNEDHHSGDNILWMFAVYLTPDGMSVGQIRCVIQSLNVGADWIICQAQDTVVLISGPGLTVWRLTLDRGVLYSYVVPGANINNYFDATVFGGVIYLFPALPDENLDFTSVHTIDTEGRTPMRPFTTRADPMNGFPGVRKQCAIDIWQGRLYIIGGQFDDATRGTFRYGDVWALDLRHLQWQRYSIQLPLLIVEPRMHVLDNGLCFLWGDCDVARGCYTNRRHFHVMRMFAGVPSLQETVWAKLTRWCPQLWHTPVEYLRDVLRVPEKFLYRVYQAQMTPGGHQQPPPQQQYHQPQPSHVTSGGYPGQGGYAGGPGQPQPGSPPPPYGTTTDYGTKPPSGYDQPHQEYGKHKKKSCRIM